MSEGSFLYGKRALVIDDELLIALDVERILLEAGAAKCVVMRKAEAFEFAPVHGYEADIVFIDFRAAKEGQADVDRLVNGTKAVVLMTTNGDSVIKHWLPPRYGVVEKPFSPSDILSATKALMD